MADAPDILQHLDALYAFAQGLTLDPATAAVLVEQAYADAYALPPEERPADVRSWLYDRVHARFVASESLPAPAEPTPPVDLRRKLAERLVEQKLPAALTLLPPRSRGLLMLCYAERRSCADAGRLLALTAEAACAELEASRQSLEDALRASLSPVEQRILDVGLPADWPQVAFPRLAQSEFAATPPTLRQRVETASAAKPLPSITGAPRRPSRLRHIAIAFLLITSAGLLGVLFTKQEAVPVIDDLLTLTIEHAAGADADLEAASPEEAAAFVRQELGRRISVPHIQGAAFQGVAIDELAKGIEAPVLLFEDRATRTPLTLHVYDYRFLDENSDRLRLGTDILQQIEDEAHYDQYDLGEQRALVWRYRDDIYVAVGSAEAAPLQDRVQF